MKRTALRLLLGLVTALSASSCWGVPPTESLLPPTTKGYLSVPDIDVLRTHWQETQLGQLVRDPVMQPFIEDLKEQIRKKLAMTDERLGLTWDDLEGVYGGEFCVAAIQPEGDKRQRAVALLVDVTGHLEPAQQLLRKVDERMAKRGATRKSAKIGGASLHEYHVPPQREGEDAVTAIVGVHQDLLLAVDHRRIAEDIINRLAGRESDALDDVPAFIAAMKRCQQATGDGAPHARWFIEPFGYAEYVRAGRGGRKKRGTDLLKVLQNQGFTAVQGLGGYVSFATATHEIMHHTLVYAPAEPRQAADGATEKYRLAARMLDFPNSTNLAPQPWVPRDLATYFTFNWRMVQAFEHSKSLVNELMGAKEGEDLFEDILGSIATDRDGPQVDIRKELISHLSERATLVSDVRLPVTTESERILAAIALDDEEAVRQTVNKAMEVDPDAKKREFDGHVIWEVLSEQAPAEVDKLNIVGGDGFDPLAQDEGMEDEGDAEKRHLPNMAITVARGQLWVASHVDAIVELLKRPENSENLESAADYQLVDTALRKLGSGDDSFRFFSRTDESYRATYELIREGKMPEAKTMLGKLLNRLMGPNEEGILREQQVDGSKLPDYQVVRRYLGPAGAFIQTEVDGWFAAGCLLTKDDQALAQRPTASGSESPSESK